MTHNNGTGPNGSDRRHDRCFELVTVVIIGAGFLAVLALGSWLEQRLGVLP